jgi:hypothetical protein
LRQGGTETVTVPDGVAAMASAICEAIDAHDVTSSMHVADGGSASDDTSLDASLGVCESTPASSPASAPDGDELPHPQVSATSKSKHLIRTI